MNNQVPALPSGFVLDQPKKTSDKPPLPKGFVLDSSSRAEIPLSQRTEIPTAENPQGLGGAAPENNKEYTDPRSLRGTINALGDFAVDAGEAGIKHAAGVGENLLSVASGASGQVVSGVNALGDLAMGKGLDETVDRLKATQENLTYTPKTKSGQDVQDAAGVLLEPIGKGLEVASNVAGEIGGGESSPATAALYSAAPQTALEALGFKGILKPRQTTAVKNLKNAPEAVKARADVLNPNKPIVSPEEIASVEKALADIGMEQSARKQLLESYGLKPLKAQITGERNDFIRQQDAAKQSGIVSRTIDEQDVQLRANFNNAGQNMAQQKTRQDVFQHIKERAENADAKITRLYQRARESAGDGKIVKLENVAAVLKKYRGSDRLTKGVIKGLHSQLKNLGLVDGNFNAGARFSAKDAESARIFINQMYSSTNDFGRKVIKELKNALDDDVFSSAGVDFFKTARAEKAGFMRELEMDKSSKFSSRKVSLVKEILEDKINPDQLTQTVINSKKYRAGDLLQLKGHLLKDKKGGSDAWNTFRAETIESIASSSFVGNPPAFSRFKFNNALDKISDQKLRVIFNKDEMQFLNDMKKIARLREPKTGTYNGTGPSGIAIKQLENRLDLIAGRFATLIRPLLDSYKKSLTEKDVLSTNPKNKIKTVKEPVIQRLTKPLATIEAFSIDQTN